MSTDSSIRYKVFHKRRTRLVILVDRPAVFLPCKQLYRGLVTGVAGGSFSELDSGAEGPGFK